MALCLLAAPHGFSQLAASFFGNQWLGIHPVLLLCLIAFLSLNSCVAFYVLPSSSYYAVFKVRRALLSISLEKRFEGLPVGRSFKTIQRSAFEL